MHSIEPGHLDETSRPNSTLQSHALFLTEQGGEQAFGEKPFRKSFSILGITAGRQAFAGRSEEFHLDKG